MAGVTAGRAIALRWSTSILRLPESSICSSTFSLPPTGGRYYSAARSDFSIHTPQAGPSKTRSSQINRAKGHPTHQTRIPPRPRTRPRDRVILLNTYAQNEPYDSTLTSEQAQAFREELSRKDLEGSWRCWELLRSSDSTSCLRHEDHARLLQLCSSFVSEVQTSKLAEHWTKRFSSFADACSQTGDVELLYNWFRLLLQLRQSDSVLAIWKDLVAQSISASLQRNAIIQRAKIQSADDEVGKEHQGETTKSEEETFVRMDTGKDGSRVDVHDLACLVVIASSVKGRSRDVVALFERVEFGSPFRTFFNLSRARTVLQSLDSSTSLSWSALEPWFRQAELARGLSSGSGGPQRIARLLGSLFQMRQTDAAFKMFETAMLASSGPDAWLAVEGCAASPSIPDARAKWTESCWSVSLSNFISLGRTDLAMKVWSHYHAKRLLPTPRIWNALLDGYAKSKNYNAAHQTWNEIMKQSSPTNSDQAFPDEQMYTTMINVLFKAKKPEEAMGLLLEMVGRRERGALKVPAETYNAVIHGLFVNRQPLRARSLLDEMRNKGPAPTIGTLNTFLRSYARVGDLESLASTLRVVGELNLIPDIVTFTTILDALLRKGGQSASDSVVKILDIMESFKIKPNVVTYTAMIKACLVGAEASNFDLASNTMFGDGADQARMKASDPSQVRIEAALELLDRMIQAKIAPTEITYTALIGGCLQNPDVVAHAFQRKLVPKHYLKPPKPVERLGETYDTVQQWVAQSPDVSLALMLLDQMRSKGLPLTSQTFRFLIEGLCSDRADRMAFLRSLDLMDEMISRPSQAYGTRKMGPFLSSVLNPQSHTSELHRSVSQTSWIVILSSLLDRLENGPRDAQSVQDCTRALATAVKLVRDMGSLSGSEGGLSLSRLVERAAGHISKFRGGPR